MKRSVFIAVFLLAGFLLLGCGSSSKNSGTHAYVVNNSAGNVDIFNIQTDGSLSASNGSPFNVGANPLCLVFAPNGKFAYGVNKGTTTINIYAVNTDGSLASSSTMTDSGYPINLAIDSTGTYLYAADSGVLGSPGISVYTIGSTGALTTNSSVPLTAAAAFLATSSSAAGFLYASIPNSGTILAFTINSSTGALTALGSPVSSGIRPTFLAFSGSYLLAADNGGQSVWVYQIQSGSLTNISGSPFVSGLNPSAIAVSGQNVYVANQNSDTISVFGISANGQLGQLSGSPYATNGTGPTAIAVSPQANAVYVGDLGTSKIDEFQIGSVNNFLSVTPFSASPLSADGGPVWIAIH